MSQPLEWSCNLAGESWLFYWLGLAWLSGTKPTAWLSSKKKLGWLRWLNSWLAPAPGVSTTLVLTLVNLIWAICKSSAKSSWSMASQATWLFEGKCQFVDDEGGDARTNPYTKLASVCVSCGRASYNVQGPLWRSGCRTGKYGGACCKSMHQVQCKAEGDTRLTRMTCICKQSGQHQMWGSVTIARYVSSAAWGGGKGWIDGNSVKASMGLDSMTCTKS